MARFLRHPRAWLGALLVVAAPADSPGVPAVPPGVASGAWSEAAACPLWWRPGEPLARVPHPAAPPVEPGGRLVETSGVVALAEARGWLEVDRPAAALAALAGAPAADPRTRLYRLAALAGQGSWAALARELDAPSAPPLPAGCGALEVRWTAQAAAGTGDAAGARAAWQALAAARPALGPYVELWRLEAAAGAGDREGGLDAWSRVAAGGLPDAARDRGRAALAELYARIGRPAEARGLHLALAAGSRGATRVGHWLAAARLADAEGQARLADELRRRVVEQEPEHATGVLLDAGLRARLGLPAIEVARALLRAGRPAEAEPFADAVLGSAAPDAVLREATLLRARIAAAGGDRDRAERDYAAFLSRWPTDPRAADVFLDRARLAYRFGDGVVARERYRSFLARYPASRDAAEALYLMADSWQDDFGADPAFADSATAAFDRLVRTWPGSYFADRARMRAAHLAFARGRWAEARDRYEAYRGSESAREARYWLARTLDALGDRAAARELWRGLAPAADWYALLSRDRLAGRTESIPLVNAGYRPAPPPSTAAGIVLLEDPSGRTAAALLELGERELARGELLRGLARAGGDRATLSGWAEGLVAWGFPDLALRLGVRLGESGAGRAWAYPRGFAGAIDAEARAHGFDALYALALIRQESLFQAGVVSPVGAVGLMQIMPATGREIADSTGWEGYDGALLADPAISLHFGARYLEDQLERFDGFWPAVLAAYNGGPHNVARWVAFPERAIDPELWIDRIPFRETRDYVKKVAAQYAIYRELYADPPASR